jgi:hypothetical protein
MARQKESQKSPPDKPVEKSRQKVSSSGQKQAPRKTGEKKPAPPKRGQTRQPARPVTPEREPWTPWGKAAKARRESKARKQAERERRQLERIEARRVRWTRRRLITARGLVFLILLIITCAIGGIVLLLMGRPYPWEALADVNEMQQFSQTLEENRERWESLGIRHYLVEIQYQDDSGTICGPVTVEVRDGIVEDNPSARDTHWFPADECDRLLDNLTIDNAFGWLDDQSALYRPGQTDFEVTFDSGFGYPNRAQTGAYGEPAAGCCWTVTWADLRPLIDQE